MELVNKDELLNEIDEEIRFWEDNDNADDSDMAYDACMVMCLQKIRRFVTKMPVIKEERIMDEYISREAALKAFKLTAKNPNKDYQRGMQDTIDCLVPEVIADIPSADVQPVKRGRWAQIGEQSAKCTACGGVLKSNGIDKTGKALIFEAVYHYCPYCGARMMKGGDTNG